MDIKDTSLTIEVDVDENDELLQPIKLEDLKITTLGIYECKGLKIWVVKKPPEVIKLPDTILPRHADDRENIKDLCITVNQIIRYIDKMYQKLVDSNIFNY